MLMVQVMGTVKCILRGLRDGDVVGEFTRMGRGRRSISVLLLSYLSREGG
jgi:hypothetical protein